MTREGDLRKGQYLDEWQEVPKAEDRSGKGVRGTVAKRPNAEEDPSRLGLGGVSDDDRVSVLVLPEP